MYSIFNQHSHGGLEEKCNQARGGTIDFVLDYQQLSKKLDSNKTKLVSVVTSDKKFTQGHKDRIQFVKRLKRYLGNAIDVFGRGICGFEDKWEILKDYKYHIVIENSSYEDYWTEKLADSYLAECFPFYYGCRNVQDYFPENSYRLIDIYDVEKSIEVIGNGIKSDLYEKEFSGVMKAKELVLNSHNIFPMLANIFDKMNPDLPKTKVVMKHETSHFDIYKIGMIVKRCIQTIKK